MKKLKNFITNCWRFKKELSNFYRWDYSYNLEIFRKSLELTKDYIEKYGNEIDETRFPKIKKMERVIELLQESNYFEKAEKQLGYELVHKYHFKKLENGKSQYISDLTEEERKRNNKILLLSEELENKDWKELWSILENDIQSWWD